MANSEHTSKQFDADLEDIRSRVLQMGGLVEIQLTTVIEGLATGGEDIISRVIETERRVNNYEKEIDDACVHVVARRQPAASSPRARRVSRTSKAGSGAMARAIQSPQAGGMATSCASRSGW